jgi:hypothetical protein
LIIAGKAVKILASSIFGNVSLAQYIYDLPFSSLQLG